MERMEAKGWVRRHAQGRLSALRCAAGVFSAGFCGVSKRRRRTVRCDCRRGVGVTCKTGGSAVVSGARLVGPPGRGERERSHALGRRC
jgi:hypothetical protein